MEDKFFNKEFWRKVFVASISQIIVLVIAMSLSIFLSGKIDKLIALSDSMGNTLERVETTITTVTGIDPKVLQEKADALKTGAGTVGEGIGDGGAETVNRIGNALKKFKEGN